MGFVRAMLALCVLVSGQVWAESQALIKTSEGDVLVKLYDEKSPINVANFKRYVEEGHYNNTLFHRTIAGFMIQGGGFDADFREKPTHAPIENESKNGLRNKRGTLAMARTEDPHSATAQFYINVANNSALNTTGNRWGYAVFGEVLEGMEIVDKISRLPTSYRGAHQDVPVRDVLIQSIELTE